MTSRCDVVVIGGGIVGLATAWQLTQQRPGIRVTLLEKESTLAFHQTGRNSGVIHSGIYYRPGSLRAENCRIGKQLLEDFCTTHGIAWQKTGKVIAATHADQLPALQNILERGRQNGIECTHINRDRLLEIEPHCAGIEAIHVPGAGIVDYPGVCQKLAELIREASGTIQLNARVTAFRHQTDHVTVVTADGSAVTASIAINCSGLHSDRIARLSGLPMRERIVPFRGEY
ncbi:MAG: FAD-dependent oxidoreductase, partial [Planctomycetaceae bacterium]|nr:FAD-dependent oxidoreductase [Planctomycetaceae bacterium]